MQQNAAYADEANLLARTASEVATKGGDLMHGVVDMMGNMNHSSKRIFDIISVIDDIAFQTNILALKAAVEAARAGDQGKGFAVVASEVRSLAQRSATAAREIQTLITESLERVENGTQLVSRAGATMQEIVQSVQRVTGIIADITQASREQSEELLRVNTPIAQMDATTQQNTALVEEAAAAANSLEHEANALATVVAVFKLLIT